MKEKLVKLTAWAESKDKLMVLILFFGGIVIRYWFSRYPKMISIIPDEVRYLSVAQSLFRGNGIKIYNLPNAFQKILYSLLIMPAFAISDKILRIRIIALINCILVCAGIFPTYLLARKHLQKKSHVLFVCILYSVYSDLAYSMTFMSENLFLPLGLLTVYLTSQMLDELRDSFDHGNENQSSIKCCRYCFWIGTLYYSLYLCKEIAAIFPIALIAFILYFSMKSKASKSTVFIDKKAVKYSALLLAGFFIPFLIMKLTLFHGMGNSYHQQDMSVFSNSFNYYYLYYGFVYYLLMAILAYGIFPFIVPAIQYGKMRKNDRGFYIFLILLVVLSAAVVSFTISARENQGDTLPRIHLRYITYLFIPLVIMMINALEQSTKINCKRTLVITSLFCAWYIYYTLIDEHMIVPKEAIMDHTMLLFLSRNADNQQVTIIVYSVIAIICAFLLGRKYKVGIIVIASALLGMNVWNTILATHMWRFDGNRLTVETLDEEEWLSGFLSENINKNILVVAENDGARAFFATFADEPNVFTVRSIDIQDYLEKHQGETIPWTEIQSSLYTPQFHTVYSSLDTVDYIVLYDDLNIDFNESCGEAVQAPFKDVKIYKLYDTRDFPKLVFNVKTVTNTDQLDQAIDEALKKGLEKKRVQSTASASADASN